MTTGVELAAQKACPQDINFRDECTEHMCGAAKSWREGFVVGVDWERNRTGRLSTLVTAAVSEARAEILEMLRSSTFKGGCPLSQCEPEDVADWLEKQFEEKK